MANELQARYLTGSTVYAVVRRNSDGQFHNGTGFEVPVSANWASYAKATTEQSTTGYYYGSMPAVAAGLYDVDFLARVGASPAPSDYLVGQATIDWSGSADLGLAGGVALAPGAISDNSFTVPTLTGPATGIVGFVLQLWRRFFKKTTLTSTQLRTWTDAGDVTVTTQPVSDDGVTQTQGPAS
jgi:hypothetical protein